MIACPSVRKEQIRFHYDLATVFYRLLWGVHIHHGLWEGLEPAKVAVERVTDTLAAEARLGADDRVLDVGCGMGGSSLRLARRRQCHVTGVTISPVQRWWAACSARLHRAADRTQFLCADVEAVELDPASFDVVWSIECTEHLFDKPRFFRRAAGWLRPGGRLAICAWLAGDGPLSDAAREQVYRVCEGFLCPSLGSRDDYAGWMRDAGLVVELQLDWTQRVARTWELCQERVRRSGVRWLAHGTNRNTARFLERFPQILEAYRTGAMRYGCFVARLPKQPH